MSSTQQLLLGEGAGGAAPVYIEDVFSTYLYTGNGSTQTITNNIDLSTKGGLVWIKSRSGTYPTGYHVLNDTVRGAQKALFTNTAGATFENADVLTAFTSTGFSVGTNTDVNGDTTNMVSWTFRKQPKFFDVVTYTGTGSAQNVAHSLGSVPGFIVYKRTSGAANWCVLARKSNGTYESFYLNTTGATQYTAADATEAGLTSTTFNPSAIFGGESNGTTGGGLYVAYLFAHDAGGFGLTGTDNVISCGSFTTDGSGNATVSLGYEPQWLLTKSTDLVDQWYTLDSMRGWPVTTSATKILAPNTSGAETTGTFGNPTATGFTLANGGATKTYIYVACRRGPMAVPTSGTSVYYPFTRAGNDTETTVTGVGFTPDLWMVKDRTLAAAFPFFDRLRGVTKRVESDSTNAEQTFSGSNGLVSLNMDGITIGAGAADGGICNDTGSDYGNWLFKRAPGFFDEVCYTGTGSAQTINHNLTVAPELIINKSRSADANSGWPVYAAPLGASNVLRLNLTDAVGGSSGWNDQTPTSTQFFINGYNTSSVTYVAYLFATCAGVSKVSSYTGTGTTLQVNCGFTAGSRFIMIKRTDDTGAWYVWDSARGIIAGNDPYLRFNSTGAEVTGTDYVDTYSAGFEISSTAPAEINANGGTYIFLAIA